MVCSGALLCYMIGKPIFLWPVYLWTWLRSGYRSSSTSSSKGGNGCSRGKGSRNNRKEERKRNAGGSSNTENQVDQSGQSSAESAKSKRADGYQRWVEEQARIQEAREKELEQKRILKMEKKARKKEERLLRKQQEKEREEQEQMVKMKARREQEEKKQDKEKKMKTQEEKKRQREKVLKDNLEKTFENNWTDTKGNKKYSNESARKAERVVSDSECSSRGDVAYGDSRSTVNEERTANDIRSLNSGKKELSWSINDLTAFQNNTDNCSEKREAKKTLSSSSLLTPGDFEEQSRVGFSDGANYIKGTGHGHGIGKMGANELTASAKNDIGQLDCFTGNINGHGRDMETNFGMGSISGLNNGIGSQGHVASDVTSDISVSSSDSSGMVGHFSGGINGANGNVEGSMFESNYTAFSNGSNGSSSFGAHPEKAPNSRQINNAFGLGINADFGANLDRKPFSYSEPANMYAENDYEPAYSGYSLFSEQSLFEGVFFPKSLETNNLGSQYSQSSDHIGGLGGLSSRRVAASASTATLNGPTNPVPAKIVSFSRSKLVKPAGTRRPPTAGDGSNGKVSRPSVGRNTATRSTEGKL
eukprot:Nk52_evm8s228 gene=Nk52_evmTU8s228